MRFQSNLRCSWKDGGSILVYRVGVHNGERKLFVRCCTYVRPEMKTTAEIGEVFTHYTNCHSAVLNLAILSHASYPFMAFHQPVWPPNILQTQHDSASHSHTPDHNSYTVFGTSQTSSRQHGRLRAVGINTRAECHSHRGSTETSEPRDYLLLF